MTDEPIHAADLVRSVTIEIEELVPVRERLPRCVGWMASGKQCPNVSRYTQQGQPVCGVHLGRPGTIFISERYRKP